MFDFDLIWKECVGLGILQLEWEFANLINLLREQKCKTILEIGTSGAGSARMFTEIADLVVSMDPYYNANIQYLQKLKSNFIFVHGFSTDKRIENYIQTICPQVDCLFIDADHSNAAVRYDYSNYKKFVKPGGIIAFHDTVETKKPGEAQVSFLWKELKTQYKQYWEFNDPTNINSNCGIGAVKTPEGE